MSKQADTTVLGPLPESDRADELEELSENALRAVLSPKTFRLRSEPGKDRGSDRYLETKIDGHDTNCRAQVQLKGTDSEKFNQDGSMSIQVDTSNLNYLLNGPSPLYVLRIEKQQELRFVWARDEAQRLESDSPNWKSQQKVSLRFERQIDDQAITEIHERILREAQLDRQVHELLARRTEAETVSVHIDAKTLEVTDPAEIHRLLLESGMTIVAAGFGHQTLELIEKLEPKSRKEPRVNLIRAYTLYTIGRHQLCDGYLSEAALERQKLAPNDQTFVDTLRSICDFRLGRVTLDQYLQQEQQWAEKAKGVDSLSHRLETLRYEHLRARRMEKRAASRDELDSLVAEIHANADAPEGLKLNARIVQLYASGQDCVLDATQRIGLEQMRTGMGLAPSDSATSATADINKRWSEWQTDIETAVNEASNLGHPILLGDAMFVRATVVATTLTRPAADEVISGRHGKDLEALVQCAMQDADTARQIYQQAGCLEAELRTKLLLADLFEINGQDGPASELATGAIPAAQAMRYDRLEEHAREHISGDTRLAKLKKALARAFKEDEDYDLSQLTDESIEQMADDCIAALELPKERAQVMARFWQSRRSIACERISWCRHLELLQNREYERHQSTMYREDPDRICVCQELGYKSRKSDTVWESVIVEFKDEYCANCSSRQPKGDTGKPS